ncbi:MAG: hypothetical protein FWD84_03065 [Oscillospiraceae bacterium]|nr:hypothetical protein [Oscillospiraceae bacterium]
MHGTLTDFSMLSGVALAILGVRDALVALGGPKVWIATGVLGAISLALNALPRLFGNATEPAREFAEALANGTSGLDTRLDKLKRLHDLYEEQPGLMEELRIAHDNWVDALGTDRVDEALDRFIALQDEAYNLQGKITALEDVVGTFGDGQLDAAIQTAIMEGAIEDAAEAVSSLKAAYQAAYDAALASINSQLGLFDRMNFEASKAVTEMASTWGYQAEDIQKHNENLQFAIQSELLPGVVSSFADINQAGNLNEVIESIRDAGYEMIVTVNPTFTISAIRQMKTGQAA